MINKTKQERGEEIFALNTVAKFPFTFLRDKLCLKSVYFASGHLFNDGNRSFQCLVSCTSEPQIRLDVSGEFVLLRIGFKSNKKSLLE